MSDTPNPGSAEAIEAGCTCPIYDNCNGEGVVIDGERMWWYSLSCPLHGEPKEGANE